MSCLEADFLGFYIVKKERKIKENECFLEINGNKWYFLVFGLPLIKQSVN